MVESELGSVLYFTCFSFPDDLDSNLNNFSPAYFPHTSTLLATFLPRGPNACFALLTGQTLYCPVRVLLFIARRLSVRFSTTAATSTAPRTSFLFSCTRLWGRCGDNACFDLCVRRARLASHSTTRFSSGYGHGLIRSSWVLSAPERSSYSTFSLYIYYTTSRYF